MRYNPALDGLRAYAVGLVLLAHLPAIQGFEPSIVLKTFASGLRAGYLGVDIFFVLSGFLVTSILLEDKRRDCYSFARFYAKRTLRIFPIFYLSVAFCALAFTLPRAEVLSNALYVSNYYYSFEEARSPLRHTWSLSVEEQFYILWPLALYLIPIGRVGKVLLVAIPIVVVVSVVVALILVGEEHFGQFVTRGAMFRILSLGAGGILAFYVSRLQTVQIGLIVGAGLVGLAGHVISLFLDTYARSILGLISMSMLAVSIFCIAYVGHERRHAWSRVLLESRPVVYLGRISYGIYLYHFIILYILDARGSDNPQGVPVTTWATFVILAIAVPALSFRFIESPLLAIKERLNRGSIKPARSRA